MLTKKASTAIEIPADRGPRITCAVALIVASKQPDPANRTVLHRAGPEAVAVDEKFSFKRLHLAQ